MTADERQDADVILTKLSEYFIPKRNKIYKRYVFNSHSQKANESFDHFLTALHKLATTCEFGIHQRVNQLQQDQPPDEPSSN